MANSVWRGAKCLGWGALLVATLLGGCSSASSGDEAAAPGAPFGGFMGTTPNNSGGRSATATGGGSSQSSGTPPLVATPGAAAPADETCNGCAGAPSTGPEFEPPGSNPFVYTAHDPLSTFGADVDTASYDLFRRYVDSGQLPPAASVRLEEYLNSFSYAYLAPPAEASVPFTIYLAEAAGLSDDGTKLLRVGIQGKLAPPEQKRPANLVFLVDVSGSMQSADKLPLVKQVLSDTIGVLDPTDTISIVTYAGSTAVRLGPTPAAQASTIREVIDGLDAGGGTAGGAGLTLAYEQASLGFIEGGINHIVLCTDGDFNVGPASTADLLALVRSKRSSGVTLTTLGFGIDNLNDAMMEAVSDAGNGIYGFIADSDHASDYVEHELLSTLVHIAKDLKIQVEFNPSQVYAYRLLGYEDRAIADADFRNDVIDAGEIGSGHRVTALYQIVPTGGSVPQRAGAPAAEDGDEYSGETEIGADAQVLVKVRYKSPTASDADPAQEVVATLGEADAASGTMDSDFAWAAAVASFAEILKQSPYADRAALDAIADIVASSAHDQRPDREEFRALFAKARALLPAP